MEITLFIDESGFTREEDDQTGRTFAPDVVAALLCRGSLEAITQRLEHHLSAFCRDATTPSGRALTKQDFHLTDLRTEVGNHTWVSDLALSLFEAVFQTEPHARLLAVTRLTGTVRSTRERDYRLMLFDLLTLASAVLDAPEPISHLNVVYATRSTDDDPLSLVAEIQGSLPHAFEWNLLTLDLMHLGDDHISLKSAQANSHWGLITADFLANIVFNSLRGYPEAQQTRDRLQNAGRLQLFEAFGDQDQRRARIAERDGNSIAALTRWLQLLPTTEYGLTERLAAIRRSVRRIAALPGTTATHNAIEIVREQLHRDAVLSTDHGRRYHVLTELESVLAEELSHSQSDLALLFRLRNYLLLTANNLANSVKSHDLVTRQNAVKGILLPDPQYLSDVLKLLLYQIEMNVNDLDLREAHAHAKRYVETVMAYQTLVSCLDDAQVDTASAPSYTETVARTILLRCELLALDTGSQPISSDIISRIETLKSALVPHSEAWNRLLCYSIWALLKQRDTQRAVDVALEQIDALSIPYLASGGTSWLWYWSARAVVDHTLNNKQATDSRITAFVQQLQARLRTPMDAGVVSPLLRREAGVLCHRVLKNGRLARQNFYTCIEEHQALGTDSAISLWLLQLARFTHHAILSPDVPWQPYFKSDNNSPPEANENGILAPLEDSESRCFAFASMACEQNSSLSPLSALRHISPY